MRANPEFIARDIAGELVLVPIGSAAQSCAGLVTCNEVGSFIWRQLEKGADEAALLAAILDEFEVDEATAKNDLHEFTEKLLRLGAIIE